MTVPYSRIRARIDVQDIPCQICGTVTVQPIIDHCHVHGWTRGVLCVLCNSVMARVDADLSTAHARELFYRDNCPDCRRDGFAGVTRRLRHGARHPADAKPPKAVKPRAWLAAPDAVKQLDAVDPHPWTNPSKAIAVRRVESAVPGLSAPQVVAVLAVKGVLVNKVYVRTVRSRDRKLMRAASTHAATSGIRK